MTPFDAESVDSYPAILWAPPRSTMRDVARQVAERYELTVEDLKGPSRHRHIAWPRQEAFALVYAQGRLSLPQIGRYFGGRDHTTVLFGIRRHKARRASAEVAQR